ncbi:MAG: hypothetical protein Q4E68_04785 [Prevotellaceae bacterium]|nr:hypothetical protein [Prevotellaceae bacterium]
MKNRLFVVLVMLLSMIVTAFGQESDDKYAVAGKLMEEGVALHDKQKYEDAIKKYDEALKLLPYHANLIYEKAYSLAAMGKRDDAKKLLEKLFKKGKVEGNLSSPYMMYANYLDEDGEQLKALEVYDTALEVVDVSDTRTIQLIHYNKALTLYNLNNENKANVDGRDRLIFYHLDNSLECDPTHPGTYLLYGNMLADVGGYYGSLMNFAIASLLAGERSSLIESAFAKWDNMQLSENSGPLTTLSFNNVREQFKVEPSEYGRLYDIFTAVIPNVCSDTLGAPVPLSYAANEYNDGIAPFFAELKRRGLLECYFHEAMKLGKVQYISNANWLVEHKADEDRLWNTINELGVFTKNLKYGYVPDSVEFTSAEVAHEHNIDAMAACKFLLTHTVDSKDWPIASKYVLSWSVASPDVSINIGSQVADWANTNPKYLFVFLAGSSFYAMTSHQKTWNKNVFANGLLCLLDIYNSDKDILGKNDSLEDILALYNRDGDEFDKFVEENYDK